MCMFSYVWLRISIQLSVDSALASYYCTAPLYGPMAICSWITLPSLSCNQLCEQHNEEFMNERGLMWTHMAKAQPRASRIFRRPIHGPMQPYRKVTVEIIYTSNIGVVTILWLLLDVLWYRQVWPLHRCSVVTNCKILVVRKSGKLSLLLSYM